MLVDAIGCRWTLDVRGLGPDLADEVERLWSRARVADIGHDGSDGMDGVDGHDGGARGRSGGAAPPAIVARRHRDGAVEVDGAVHRVGDEDVPYVISRAVTLASIRRRTGQCLMLHAAGLAAPDGSTVALVAASGTGKTTAGLTLGRTLGYVSDETVAVEADLTVRAHPKPLSVVTDPRRPLVKHERSPDDLGLRPAPPDLRLVATVVLERDPDATEPVLEAIGLVEAATLVLPQTSALPSLDRPLDRLAGVLAAGHGPWRLRYAEIGDCADLVAGLAAGHAPGGTPGGVAWEWVDGRGRPDPGPSSAAALGPESVVRRAAFDDALVSDGSVLVLRDRVPTTLPGLAATLWRRLERPTRVPALVETATAALGPHPDAEAIVLDTVRVLHDGGLVVLG
ncbi:MAG TPA: hypothetical protein VFL46_08755 [Phycicoccus sp.]|nr:hypothetical protein [Phycicoccus sp.]